MRTLAFAAALTLAVGTAACGGSAPAPPAVPDGATPPGDGDLRPQVYLIQTDS